MPIASSPHGPFDYEAKHRVLICRECRYAVQKSALGSHMLRHKIYRGKRQRLLSSLSRLDLVEPDDVQLPPNGSPPVGRLPIIPGYRCTAPDCGNLCASSKRMRHHWRETHGESNPPESFALSVTIQTFFRGTKLRYFEVVSPEPAVANSPATSDARRALPLHPDTVATPAPRAQTPVLSSATLCYLDLETLNYFHHFITATSLTLPTENQAPTKYWQADTIAQALRLRWLMGGLLAISAIHLATVSVDEATKQRHLDRSGQLQQEFFSGWEELQLGPGLAEIEEAKTGAQIICLLRCCHWRSDNQARGQELIPNITPFQLQSFAAVLQGCVDPSFALLSAVSSAGIPENTFVRATKMLETGQDTESPQNIPPAVLDRLRALPYRMAEVLEKPDSALDFFATLSTIDILVECFSLSYASDDAAAVWRGMKLWVRRVSDHFNQMVWRRYPAALIVFGHWVLLLERVERHSWFLSGLSAKVLHQVVMELPPKNTIRSLVENLLA